MITRYETKKVNGENIIILYLDFSFEIGGFDSKTKKGFLSTIKKYIRQLNLKENYQKILLVSGSLVVATVMCVNNDLNWLSSLDNHSDIVENVQKIYSDNEKLFETKSEEVEQENMGDYSSEENNSVNAPKEESNLEIDKTNDLASTISSTSANKSEYQNESQSSQLVTISKEEIKKEENIVPKEDKLEATQRESDLYTENVDVEVKKQMVTVYRNNGKVLEIELEEYVVGVVAAEMPASFSSEALKAQSVVARTYALRRISRGEKLTDTVSTQAYIDTTQMKNKWGNEYSKYYNKIKAAVFATEGEYITYQGAYINAVYHSTSNGYTEDAINVWGESYPYLKSVESSWDKNVSSYQRTITKDYQNILDITGLQSDESIEIKILCRNQSGRVETVQVGDRNYTGVEFRNLLGLRSADFDIEIIDGNIEITTKGYGHGVGMSQYGANEMAKQGYNYKQIIKHYYTGVEIQK